jgi:hypothetical protein
MKSSLGVSYYFQTSRFKSSQTEGDIAYDSAGVNDGILNGGPLWQPFTGQVDGALQLDGIDDYVITPVVLNPSVLAGKPY